MSQPDIGLMFLNSLLLVVVYGVVLPISYATMSVLLYLGLNKLFKPDFLPAGLTGVFLYLVMGFYALVMIAGLGKPIPLGWHTAIWFGTWAVVGFGIGILFRAFSRSVDNMPTEDEAGEETESEGDTTD